MHPSALARETSLAQQRTIEAATDIGEMLKIEVAFPSVRTTGDLNAIQVSALKQRQAVADFLEKVADTLTDKKAKPEPTEKKKGQ